MVSLSDFQIDAKNTNLVNSRLATGFGSMPNICKWFSNRRFACTV